MFNPPVQTHRVQLAEANNRHESAAVGKAIMTAPMIPPTNTMLTISIIFSPSQSSFRKQVFTRNCKRSWGIGLCPFQVNQGSVLKP